MRQDPWSHNVKMVDAEGYPTVEFLRWLQTSKDNFGEAVPDSRLVDTGTGLVGGGDLTEDLIISLDDTAVTPGIYGDASNYPVLTVDQQGRITLATELPLPSGGGAAWTLLSNTTIAAPTASIVVDVSAYSEVMVLGRLVTTSGAANRGVFVSTDGGATYFITTGNYIAVAAAGTETPIYIALNHGTPVTNARSFGGIIYNLRDTIAAKLMLGTFDVSRYFVANNNPITHIQIGARAASAGALINMTGGTVQVWGR